MRSISKNIEIGAYPSPPISEHGIKTADTTRIVDLVITPLKKNSFEEILKLGIILRYNFN